MSEKQATSGPEKEGEGEGSPLMDPSKPTDKKSSVNPNALEKLMTKLGKLTVKEKEKGMN